MNQKYWVIEDGKDEPVAFFENYGLAAEHVLKNNLNATILENLADGHFKIAKSNSPENQPFTMEKS